MNVPLEMGKKESRSTLTNTKENKNIYIKC